MQFNFRCREGKEMKRFENFKIRWKNLMDSTQKKLSRGASNIARMISWARLDNWRRYQKSEKKFDHKKHDRKD